MGRRGEVFNPFSENLSCGFENEVKLAQNHACLRADGKCVSNKALIASMAKLIEHTPYETF